MNPEELITQARRISKSSWGAGKLAEAKEFLRIHAGEKNGFFRQLNERKIFVDAVNDVSDVLQAFIRHVENGLLEGISIERKVQIDVVSDFLDQANTLLNSKGVHPAAPAVIIGAALEEFLRNWIEEAGLALGGKKPSLDSYAKVLKEKALITKQDVKDITSWSGLRNHAAHGEWEEVNDKKRVSLMLEGVNFFMRKYGEH